MDSGLSTCDSQFAIFNLHPLPKRTTNLGLPPHFLRPTKLAYCSAATGYGASAQYPAGRSIGANSLGISVVHVPDARKAIHRLSGDDPLPDLIVLDPSLAGMTANQFLEWTSRSDPAIKKIPVVIYTGVVVVEDALKSLARGTFFKSPEIFQIQTTVQQMCRLAASE